MRTSVVTLSRRLTPAKQQELISRNQFAERLIQFGWMPHVPEDLGEDFIVHVYFEGRATGVVFHVQIKSIINLQQRRRRRGKYVAYDDFKIKDLKHWDGFSHPVVLVVWDIDLREGRWLLVKDAIAYLDQRRPEWRARDGRITVHFPWQNTTDERGLVYLRRTLGQALMPLLTNGKPLEFTLTLKSDASADPAQLQRAVSDWIHAGGELSDEQFREAKLQFGPPEFGRWIGEFELEDFRLTADQPVSRHQAQFTVLDRRGQSLVRQQVELERRHQIRVGQHYVEFTNAVSSAPVVVSLIVPITNLDPLEIGPCEFSWRIQHWGHDAVEALEIARFWRAWDTGKLLRLNFDGAGGWLEFVIPAHPGSGDSEWFERGMEQLCMLQHRLGRCFQMSDDGPSEKDLESIDTLAEIVRQGKHEIVTQKAVLTTTGIFDRPGLEKLIDLHKSQEDVDMHVSGVFEKINLFEDSIDLGPVIQHIHGKIDFLPDDIDDLIRRAPVETSLRIGFDDVTRIEIYPDWFRREAERLAHLLIEECGAEKVYLFGSLVWTENYASETDIDLAVQGLDSTQLLDAIHIIEKESDFSVDLVDLDRVPHPLRDRIVTSGVVLNGAR